MTDVYGHGGSDISFSIKDLLLELRADIRAIDNKLELKADREQVHELRNEVAAVKLVQVQREGLIDEFRKSQVALEEIDNRITGFEGWRNRAAGAVAVAVLFTGLLSALFFYVITNGTP